MNVTRTRKITLCAIMSAMSVILMRLGFPLPFFPPFLKLDISDIPAAVTAFAIGPLWGAAVVLIRNLVHAFSSQTGFVGELSNFLIGAMFVLPLGFMYQKNRTKKGAVIGLAASVICMAIAGYFVNMYITLPFYSNVMKMPLEQVVQMSQSANSNITGLQTLLFYGITPFNLFKGALVSVLTFLIYKPLSPMLHR